MLSQPLKILILEDNNDLREGWVIFFESQGHSVRAITLAEELLSISSDFKPDVYVIDLNLPDADGLDIVRQLRAVHPNIPVVITTARTQIGDKVLGYDSGADIYFTKPVDPQELLAGITALARRRHSSADIENSLYLKLDRHQLRGPASTVDLTPSEVTLLASLIKAAGEPLARWQIAQLLGVNDELPSDAMVEMRITRLRKRFNDAGAEGQSIKSVYKQGYVLSCKVLMD
jgi:DNA-binding response OmpR family regulator